MGSRYGTRTVEFDLAAQWDGKGKDDRLAVYLVDLNDPQETYLDEGLAGAPVFTLSETGTESITGITTYKNGHLVINTSSILDVSRVSLVVQLLNGDVDSGSQVRISNLAQNYVDERPVLQPGVAVVTRVAAGREVNLNAYQETSNAYLQVSKVSFDLETGKYATDLQVVNNGTSKLSRRALVRQSASGFDA